MKRRSFLKRVGMLVGFAYMSPISLIPEIPLIPNSFVKPVANSFVNPNVIATKALSELEWALTFIKPAMQKLADTVDKDIS